MADDRTSTGVGFAYPAWNSILGRDDLLNLFALRALIYRLAGDWDACAARCIAFLVWAASPSVIISFIFCPRAWLYRLPVRMGRLPGVG